MSSTVPTLTTPLESTDGRSRHTWPETLSSEVPNNMENTRGFHQLPFRMLVPQVVAAPIFFFPPGPGRVLVGADDGRVDQHPPDLPERRVGGEHLEQGRRPPEATHRRNRLYTASHAPNSAGRSRHGTPVRARYSRASKKSRSGSFGFGPWRVPLGLVDHRPRASQRSSVSMYRIAAAPGSRLEITLLYTG